MADWRIALRRHRGLLVTQFSLNNFNGVLDRLYGEGVLSKHKYENLLKTAGDSNSLVEDKVRSLLGYLEENLTEDRLRIFHQALLEVELTDVAKLIEKDLPQPQVCPVNKL